eukprot:m.235800 g.235800  ORF g.235800 m.235800 type:complete len:886 (+) comp54317_c0_seq1:164-2821(+)
MGQSSSQAREDSAMLIGSFKVVYLGSMLIRKIKGVEIIFTVEDAIKQMQTMNMKVLLRVFSNSIVILARDESSVVHNVELVQVAYCLQLPSEPKKFAFVTHDPRSGRLTCHVFLLKAASATMKLLSAVTFAFKANKAPQPVRSASASQLSSPVKQPSKSAFFKRSASTLDEESTNKRLSTSSDITDLRLPSKSRSSTANALAMEGKEVLGKYSCRYLGSVPVAAPKGQDTVIGAISLLQSRISLLTQLGPGSTKLGAKVLAGDQVDVVINAEGVRVMDSANAEVLQSVFIKDVSFTSTQCIQKEDYFVFISQDEKLVRTSCHIFSCDAGQALKICECVGKAFALNAQSSGDNPFKPLALTTIEVGPQLATKEIDRIRLSSLKVLGTGQFGMVYLADHRVSESSIINRAVKMLRDNASVENQREFMHEAEIMAGFNHPSIINLVGVATKHKPLLVVLEFMQYGDLKNVLQTIKEKRIELSVSEQLLFCHQIASALSYLTHQGLIHCDVAARNCLLHTGNAVKLADFGLTQRCDAGKDTFRLKVALKLPIKWLAIEVLTTKTLSELTDMWSFGVTMWEIFSYGELPYVQHTNREVHKFIEKGLRLSSPVNCPSEIFEVMATCWGEDKKRLRFKDMVQIIQQFEAKYAVKSRPIRDIGEAINSGLTENIRRMSMAARQKSPTMQKEPAGAASLSPASARKALLLSYKRASIAEIPVPSIAETASAPAPSTQTGTIRKETLVLSLDTDNSDSVVDMQKKSTIRRPKAEQGEASQSHLAVTSPVRLRLLSVNQSNPLFSESSEDTGADVHELQSDLSNVKINMDLINDTEEDTPLPPPPAPISDAEITNDSDDDDEGGDDGAQFSSQLQDELESRQQRLEIEAQRLADEE